MISQKGGFVNRGHLADLVVLALLLSADASSYNMCSRGVCDPAPGGG